MRYRLLGKTGLSVSSVGIGSWQLGGAWGKDFTQQEVNDLLSKGSELGINFIDTAECYGDHLSEMLIGEAIRGQRDQWIVATKFGHNWGNGLPKEDNYKPEQVLVQLEASLRALKTDYIDIYQLHSAGREEFDNQELWTMLEKQVQAGKVRFLGNSIGQPSMLYQVQKSTDYGISVIQTIYNAVKRKAEETVLPVADNQNLGVIARVPLASGFLSGKYQPGARFIDSDIRSKRPEEGLDAEIAAALDALKEKPDGIDAASWAIAWCLKQPRISTVIPGCKTIEQLLANAAGADLDL
ncbi:MAG: aldo/keto reductase [Pseudomonadales bacterium]|nr:aldo/keto reductase [Pseudomonadales bacterium]